MGRKILIAITVLPALYFAAKWVFSDEDHKQMEELKLRANKQVMFDEANAVTDLKGLRWARFNGGIYPVNQ